MIDDQAQSPSSTPKRMKGLELVGQCGGKHLSRKSFHTECGLMINGDSFAGELG